MSMKNSNDTIGNRIRDLKQPRHRVPQKYVKLRPYFYLFFIDFYEAGENVL